MCASVDKLCEHCGKGHAPLLLQFLIIFTDVMYNYCLCVHENRTFRQSGNNIYFTVFLNVVLVHIKGCINVAYEKNVALFHVKFNCA